MIGNGRLRFTWIALAIAFAPSVAVSQPFTQKALDRALELVPPDAAGFVCVPSLKRLNDDLVQCLERMDRPGTAVIGRPIDQIKARLGIAVAVEDRGSLVAWWPAADESGDAGAVRLLVPTEDGAAFLAGNFEAAPDAGANAYRGPGGSIWFARSLAGHVLLSTDAAAVEGYAAKGGLAAPFRERMGAAWDELDVIAWGGPVAMRDLTKQGRAAMPADFEPPPGYDAEAAERWRGAFEQSLTDGLVAIDVDPLGVAVRTFAKLAPESPLGEMVANASLGEASLDRVPGAPFYLAGSLDLAAIGGVAPLRAFAKLAGLPEGLWLDVAANLRKVQLAVYPSKLGIAAGGFFNDAALAIEADDPAALRQAIETGVLAAAGDAAGLRWKGAFERDRTLKNGDQVDAFEVSQMAIPGGEQGAIGAVDLAQRQLVWQIAFGSRGLNGFLEPAGGSWSVLTFSQRPDVLGRAIEAASGGGPGLDRDGAVRALRRWLPTGAQAVGFIGIGQFGKLLKQVARMVPGGGEAALPDIPANIEPVAFGLTVRPGSVETSLVLPAGVLGLGYDQILDSVMRGAGVVTPGESNASDEAP
ncbi:MAG: hypothetical protein ACO38V_10475 [Phycisphaerales bacterium]